MIQAQIAPTKKASSQMRNLYQITLMPNSDTKDLSIRRKMDEADEWFRFGGYYWIILTDKDADFWANELVGFCQPDGTLFICRLDATDRQGWMTKQFWDWLGKRDADLEKDKA